MWLLHLYILQVAFGLYILSRQDQSDAAQVNKADMIFFSILEENLDLSIVREEVSVRTFVDCIQQCLSRLYCYSIYFKAQSKLCQLSNGSLDRSLENVNGLVTYADYDTEGLRYFIKVGQRVIRGPTWDWADEDGPGNLGTVTSFDNDIWWFVTWDHGVYLNYRMGKGYEDLLVVG
ncbi:hypothetical protein CHS0354_006776 [Potamilus streckersoni]|uniref:MIB/HERC2 domain-containing protein n=1 Tax=Potamilus streckersoni TaxID=2493646 RepID=A0AAE0S862_9BIVA|nr:hypothetical protein CHS0354_006776 [Potamilus streckersoni]